jgi:blue copper oxidase
MFRREFLISPLLLALQSCRSIDRFATTPEGAPTAHALLPVSGAIELHAKLLDPICGTSAFIASSVANPTLVVERGQTMIPTLNNTLPQPTTIHWHGLRIPAAIDGDGRNLIHSGQTQTAQFTVTNRSGLYWYHAHPHGYSAEQVHEGLAGLVIVRDADDRALETALGTALGKTDLALVLKDTLWIKGVRAPYRRDNANPIGSLGNTVTVNDQVAPQMSVTRGWIRLRLLNASNTRALLIEAKLSGATLPIHLLGTDGGLLAAALETKQLFLHPGERVDFAIDCRSHATNETVTVASAEFDPRNQLDPQSFAKRVIHNATNKLPPLAANSLCVGGEEAALADGAPMPLFTLRMNTDAIRNGTLPAQLSLLEGAADDGTTQRKIALAFNANTGWTINNLRWGEENLTQRVARGAREIWELHNSPVSTPHPMHLHGFSFRVLSRRGLFGPARALATYSNGRVATDFGVKDTATVWPNERVRIAIDFSHTFPGEQRYLFHCHNLQHEDQMMMLPVVVT